MTKIFVVHPGEILREDFMKPMGLTANGLADDLCVPLQRILEITEAKRAITADIAIRLSIYFGLPAQFWLKLQNDYNLQVARQRKIEGPSGRRQAA